MLITTAINYTNGDPHIGHCYEAILTDFIARYYRAFGKKVFFQTGTDEHGQKIADKAAEQGLSPKELCDHYAGRFRDLASKLELSHDHFIRTTDPHHEVEVQRIFTLLEEQGDIYLSTYEGWYNIREETFVTELEARLNEYKDPVTGTDLTRLSEPSYFFKLTKYLPAILAHIESHPDFIIPQSRRQEIIRRLQTFLSQASASEASEAEADTKARGAEADRPRDLSISRTTFDWGIPVPQNPEHCLYVWMEALLNYYTGPCAVLGPEQAKRIAQDGMIHVIGKDILWFHAVIWPAILMALKFQLPTSIWTHDFVSAADGKKMSKSLGNVVEPLAILEKHGVAQTRFYLLKQTSLALDLHFNEEHLIQAHRTELAAKLGNLVNRILNIAKRYSGGLVPKHTARPVFDAVLLMDRIHAYLKEYRVSQIVELVQEAIHAVNQDIVKTQIWMIGKGEDPPSDESLALRGGLVRSYLESLMIIARLWAPINPGIAGQIFSALGQADRDASTLLLLNKATFWQDLRPGTPLLPKLILFPA